MNEREYIIAKAKELGVTTEELGIEPKVKIETVRDTELIEQMRKVIEHFATPEDARDYISEKYWDDLGIQKKKYKIVKCRMKKEIYKDIYVAIPNDENEDNVDRYIDNTYNLDTDYPDDEEDWELWEADTEEIDMTADEVNSRGQDEIWNYNDFED